MTDKKFNRDGGYFELVGCSKEFELLLHNIKDREQIVPLYRVRATEDFTVDGREVKAGDLGGWVASVKNLEDKGWVFDESKVFDYAKVTSGSCLRDNAIAYDFAVVCDKSTVADNARVYGNSVVGNCQMMNNEELDGNKVLVNDVMYPKNDFSGSNRLTYRSAKEIPISFRNKEITTDERVHIATDGFLLFDGLEDKKGQKYGGFLFYNSDKKGSIGGSIEFGYPADLERTMLEQEIHKYPFRYGIKLKEIIHRIQRSEDNSINRNVELKFHNIEKPKTVFEKIKDSIKSVKQPNRAKSKIKL